MIYSFGGRNFYSFRDDFIVDFRVKPQANQREIFHNTISKYRINSVMAIFGANASGKTHLLKTLGFLQWFIQHSAKSQNPDEHLDEIFFKFSAKPEKNTDLFIEFEMNHEHYRYAVTVNPQRVVKEGLYVKKTKFTYLFERIWNNALQSYDFKARDFGADVNKIPQRQNASFISTALLLENPKARQIDQFFNTFYGNICAFGRTERYDPHPFNLFETAEFFQDKKDLLQWVNDRLEHFDLGLHGIEINKAELLNKEGKTENTFIPIGIHRHEQKEFKMPLFMESRGTQALFILLRYILPVLQSGGVAFIDEFELGLHSHMIQRLIDLFYTKKYNPKRAQLIFSCHSDFIISRLEKYQIILVDKNSKGVSDTYRLDALKGVRNVDNHYAKYHAGVYGGTPEF